MTKLRVAGINFDHMYMGDLLRQVFDHPGAEIVGIYDKSPDKMAQAITDFAIPKSAVYMDLDTCMAKTKPDLAIVCAAPTEHAGHVEALAAYNVHVLVEKPFAGSVADARRMLHAMAGTGKLMAINWPLAWYPCHVTCKRLIYEGLIGNLREVHFYDGNRGPLFRLAGKVEVTAAEVERQKPHYWWYKKASGRSSLLDYLGFGATLGTWFMPRKSWLVDRANIQFGDEFYEKSIRGRAMFFEAAAEAETLEDLFHRLEDCGQLLRLDKDIWPTMYRCSTVTRAELAQLRRIENVVRLVRVTHLTAGEIVLADGTAPTPGPTLHIDCTADGLPNQPPRSIFEAQPHYLADSAALPADLLIVIDRPCGGGL